MKLIDEHFTTGQAAFSNGVGLRTVVEHFGTIMDGGQEAEALSYMTGYLDQLVYAIRCIHNLGRFPGGPDK